MDLRLDGRVVVGVLDDGAIGIGRCVVRSGIGNGVLVRHDVDRVADERASESRDFLRCHVQERGDLGAALRPRADGD